MEETISLKEIFDILRKHIALIFISLFAGVAIAGAVTFFVITPQYSSRAQLIVSLPQSENSAGNVNDVNFNLQMLNTYKDIIKESDSLAATVQENLAGEYDIQMTPAEIKGNLQVTQSQNSQMFSISATSPRAVDAERIANTAAEVFQQTVSEVLTNVESITIVSEATASARPVSPNNKLNLAIGLILGTIVGIGLAFLIELLDRTVKDQKFVTESIGFTILGTVPQMSQKELSATTKKLPKKAVKELESKQEIQQRRSRSRV